MSNKSETPTSIPFHIAVHGLAPSGRPPCLRRHSRSRKRGKHFSRGTLSTSSVERRDHGWSSHACAVVDKCPRSAVAARLEWRLSRRYGGKYYFRPSSWPWLVFVFPFPVSGFRSSPFPDFRMGFRGCVTPPEQVCMRLRVYLRRVLSDICLSSLFIQRNRCNVQSKLPGSNK